MTWLLWLFIPVLQLEDLNILTEGRAGDGREGATTSAAQNRFAAEVTITSFLLSYQVITGISTEHNYRY